MYCHCLYVFFFFKQKTAYELRISDWSSDVCSSDLSQVAEIGIVEGPPAIMREAAQRRVVIQANVRDRDMGGFVAEAQQALASQVQLPAGYFVTWGDRKSVV